MRVDYKVNFNTYISEWVCVEHPPQSYARRKAEQWWQQRSDVPVPETAEEAVHLADCGVLAPARKITVSRKASDRFDRV